MQAAQQISKFKPRMERNAVLESVYALGPVCSETFHSYTETGRYSRLYFKEQQVTFVTMLLHSRLTSLSPVSQELSEVKGTVLVDAGVRRGNLNLTY